MFDQIHIFSKNWKPIENSAAWTDLRLRQKTSRSNSKLDLVVFIVWEFLGCRPLQAAVKHKQTGMRQIQRQA